MSGHDHDHGHDGDMRFTPEFWDARYRTRDRIWSGDPNVHLVAELADLPPGTALDAGCGEGADALWLARRGWRVTGVDVSTVALERAAASAAESDPDAAARITWQQLDLTSDAPEPGAYDLVSAQFLHFPPAIRAQAYERLAAAVAPGGTLFVAAHHPSVMHTDAQRPQHADLYFTAGEIAASLDAAQWEIVVADVRPRTGRLPDGDPIDIEDAVLRARRVA